MTFSHHAILAASCTLFSPLLGNDTAPWSITIEGETGTLNFATQTGHYFDLFESGNLHDWKRPSGWPKIATSDLSIHIFPKQSMGYFKIIPLPVGTVLNPIALSYTGSVPDLPTKSLLRIGELFDGLESLGLQQHLVDGACYRADTQRKVGEILYSFKGHSDVVMVNEPTRTKNGILFDGIDDYAHGAIPARDGARTLIAFHSGSYDTTSNLDIPIVQLRNSGSGSFNINQAGINGQISQYSGSGSVRSILAKGWNRISVHLVGTAAKDDGLENPNSYQHRAYPAGNIPTGVLSGTDGVSSFTVDQLRFCVSANPQFTSVWGNAERLIAGWLLFESALTEQQLDQVVNLGYQTIYPKYRWIWEGDSITNDIQSRYSDKGEFRGGNREHINRWAGGQTSTHGVQQLGAGGYVLPWNENTQTSLGINDEIASDEFPVFCWIGFGANDLGGTSTTSVSSIHQNMRTMAAYAKERGMIVIVPTVTKGWSIVSNSRDEDRKLLNSLLLEDEGSHFDYVVDVDAEFTQLGGIDYHLNPAYFRDQLHYSNGTGGGSDVAARLLEQKIRHLLP